VFEIKRDRSFRPVSSERLRYGAAAEGLPKVILSETPTHGRMPTGRFSAHAAQHLTIGRLWRVDRDSRFVAASRRACDDGRGDSVRPSPGLFDVDMDLSGAHGATNKTFGVKVLRYRPPQAFNDRQRGEGAHR